MNVCLYSCLEPPFRSFPFPEKAFPSPNPICFSFIDKWTSNIKKTLVRKNFLWTVIDHRYPSEFLGMSPWISLSPPNLQSSANGSVQIVSQFISCDPHQQQLWGHSWLWSTFKFSLSHYHSHKYPLMQNQDGPAVVSVGMWLWKWVLFPVN